MILLKLEWLPELLPEFSNNIRLKIELQRGEVGNWRIIEQFNGAIDMFLAAAFTTQAKDDPSTPHQRPSASLQRYPAGSHPW